MESPKNSEKKKINEVPRKRKLLNESLLAFKKVKIYFRVVFVLLL